MRDNIDCPSVYGSHTENTLVADNITKYFYIQNCQNMQRYLKKKT